MDIRERCGHTRGPVQHHARRRRPVPQPEHSTTTPWYVMAAGQTRSPDRCAKPAFARLRPHGRRRWTYGLSRAIRTLGARWFEFQVLKFTNRIYNPQNGSFFSTNE